MRTALLLLLAAPLAAQHTHDHGHPPTALDSAQVAFLDTAERALDAFAEPADALAAGFRPLGPDMPHMGQHWVHPGRAVSRTFAPAEPSMLTYLPVDGKPMLTGAAWTIPVGPGEAPPDFPWPGAWHAHAGRLMDEAFGLVPHGVRDADRPRLAMLHAWTGVPNPEGPFTADNWALPFVRAGVPVPHHVPPDAGRAVALAAGYAPFFREAVVRTAVPPPETLTRIEAALDACAAAVRTLLAERPAEASDVAALEAEWARLGDAIREAAPDLWPRLTSIFSEDVHTGTHAIASDD
ncbi:hypothetical protein [Rubrivirga marina]|uniref:Uncharacterized protein n=1 Tax=Rubrivirga marina TaxID=1196024 RepID=A0A271J3S8_9BACT|nr:hypothetical protein [Rubrivirga marina]PAP77694.1 hypothetical protein BSZ37_15210 [Rubrivirga marina]